MLRFFQNYHKSALGLIVGLFVCIAMLGFGVNLGGGNTEQYAMKINDQEISYSEFQRRRRSMEAQFRQRFGEQFYKLGADTLASIYQGLIDSMISEALLREYAEGNDLFIGERELQRHLQDTVFAGNYSREAYLSYLRQTGISAAQFESEVHQDMLDQLLQDVLKNAFQPSRREAEMLLRQEETVYDVKYAEIDPSTFVDKVVDPEADELDEYYSTRAVDFEQPERIAYEYMVFDAKDFLDAVELIDEDIEMFYVDNQREFRVPEKVKARQIQLLYPEDGDAEAMVAVQEQAQEVHGRAVAGEDFPSLVQQYSDDFSSKVKDGDLGWVRRGDRSASFDEAVFATGVPGVVDLVEEDFGFLIVMVDEYQEAGVKDLTEVRADIERQLREREAPAYASVSAQEIFDEWISSGKDFNSFKGETQPVASTEGLLEKRSDPADLRGLTAKVLDDPTTPGHVIELGDKTVLVHVTEYLEADIPGLEIVKDAVLEQFRNEKSVELARAKADELVQKLAEPEIDLKTIADKEELKVVEKKGEKSSGYSQGVLGESEVRQAIFSTQSEGSDLGRFFEHGGKLYLIEVAGIIAPDDAVLKDKLDGYYSKAQTQLAQTFHTALFNRLKSSAEVDVQSGLVGG